MIKIDNLHLHYGEQPVIKGVSMDIQAKSVTAFIGPSGCGKSSLLRCINRMNDLIEQATIPQGSIYIDGQDIYEKKVEVTELRRKVGMVFQKPNPFPMSIFENVAYGLRIQGLKKQAEIREKVMFALDQAALRSEVENRLEDNALGLSGGQQQRLVIARAIAVQPEIILLDEPASALDPISTLKVEELILQLKENYTIVIVTHNMQQAARVSDETAFLFLGDLVEFDKTKTIFTNPSHKKTEDYISGRYG